ncbi:MAG: hypothetical protein VCD00_15920 [Candidatus Hydrogenedentota bacterium]
MRFSISVVSAVLILSLWSATYGVAQESGTASGKQSREYYTTTFRDASPVLEDAMVVPQGKELVILRIDGSYDLLLQNQSAANPTDVFTLWHRPTELEFEHELFLIDEGRRIRIEMLSSADTKYKVGVDGYFRDKKTNPSQKTRTFLLQIQHPENSPLRYRHSEAVPDGQELVILTVGVNGSKEYVEIGSRSPSDISIVAYAVNRHFPDGMYVIDEGHNLFWRGYRAPNRGDLWIGVIGYYRDKK